jgi:charged multivesicular body protein 5
MKRLFGQKKDAAPAPTLDDANSRLGNRGDSIDTRCKKIVEELLKLKQQIAKTRGPS